MTMNKFFAPSTLGFYTAEMEKPDDAVEVCADVETFLRAAVIWGAETFSVHLTSAEVTYPAAFQEYVSQWPDAPMVWPVVSA